MVEVELTIGNDDIPAVRSYLAAQKKELTEGMIAGRPTTKTRAATLLFTIINRIGQQLDAHEELCREKDEAERAARRKG